MQRSFGSVPSILDVGSTLYFGLGDRVLIKEKENKF